MRTINTKVIVLVCISILLITPLQALITAPSSPAS
jgi:hypothetical protein